MSNESNWSKFAQGYSDQVYSLTAVPEKRKRIIEQTPNKSKILIVWCWSETHLQEELLRTRSQIQITACDFNYQMLEESKKRFASPHLSHIEWDTKNLPFLSWSFDAVISTNSIIPPLRKDVIEMYRSIHRVLREWWSFLAFLPSFECSLWIRNQFPQLPIQFDTEQSRIIDTTWWQCFHTEKSIKKELKEAWFKTSECTIVNVWIDNNDELSQLIQVYWPDIAPLIWEYFINIRKTSSTTPSISTRQKPNTTNYSYTTPHKIEKLPWEKFQAELYHSAEITQELVKKISDFYRWTFNTEKWHYLIYPSTWEFVSPYEIFGKKYPSIEEMDKFKDYPSHHVTWERAQLFHDPDVTFQKLSDQLKENAFLVILREIQSWRIAWITFEYLDTLANIFLKEWQNEYYYMKEMYRKWHERDFQVFLNWISLEFESKWIKQKISPDTKMLAWNCTTTAEWARWLDNMLWLVWNLHRFALESNKVSNDIYTIFEVQMWSTAHESLLTSWAFNVSWALIWKQDLTLMMWNIRTLSDNYSLSTREYMKLHLRRKKLK